MSVFGGDSWAREAHHRKRRVDDLLLPSSSSSTYRKLSSGKFACLVCPNNPVLDSPLMLSMHSKGSRHLAAESRMRKRELSIQAEANKRIALSDDSDCGGSSNGGGSAAVSGSKPLIERTRKAVLELQRNVEDEGVDDGRLHLDAKLVGEGAPTTGGTSDARGATEVDGRVLAEWREEQRKRREMELRFTSAGWKRDCHGKWYRDENVEFDSDEKDPNILFGNCNKKDKINV